MWTQFRKSLLASAGGDACGCQNLFYIDPVSGVASGYVHVYEIDLQAGGTTVPVTITYSITPFSGSLVAEGCDTDVTPQDLKIRVEDSAGNYAEAAMPDGWSGSVVWDGNWSGGGA